MRPYRIAKYCKVCSAIAGFFQKNTLYIYSEIVQRLHSCCVRLCGNTAFHEEEGSINDPDVIHLSDECVLATAIPCATTVA